MPSIHCITVYPIKSFDGHDLSSVEVLPNGALANDRRFALVDKWGKYTNGKNCPAIHRIRARYSADLTEVELSCDGRSDRFELGEDSEKIAEFCGEILGQKCRLIANDDGGFPDDCESPGPTLIATTTLQAVAHWFKNMGLGEVRRRFRFNLEVEDTDEFWEDGLVPEIQKVRRFRTGKLVWQGSGICKRCVVPTRSSLDGTVTKQFVKEFVERRQASLPGWAPQDRFDTFYRLGINTRLDSESNGQFIQVGDEIEIT